jgi:hypothetical protein
MRKIGFTGAVADARVAALAQYAVAFTCSRGRVGKMMVDPKSPNATRYLSLLEAVKPFQIRERFLV